MYNKILDSIKVVLLAFVVWTIWDLAQHIKAKTDEVLATTQETSQKTLEEVANIRKDTFSFLESATLRTDKRINSIQKDTFNRIDKAESDVMVKVDTAVKDVNDQLTQTNKTVGDLAQTYSQIPGDVKIVLSRFDQQTDCSNNELCWQNLTGDLLKDTRNVVRDGSSTFRLVNSEFPQLITNTKIVSDVVARTLPPTALSIQQTADHIQRITKPHWYDRIISYGISGGMLYFTARKTY